MIFSSRLRPHLPRHLHWRASGGSSRLHRRLWHRPRGRVPCYPTARARSRGLRLHLLIGARPVNVNPTQRRFRPSRLRIQPKG